MKIVLDTDDMTVNEKGECLRNLVFDPKKGYGCYANFDVNDGFEPIDPKKYPALYEPFAPDPEYPFCGGIKVSAYESKDLVVMWWWEGDGNLLIWIKGEKYAHVNWDCKNDCDWTEIDAL